MGEFVIVQSFVDKSHEDLGVVVQIMTTDEFESSRPACDRSEDPDETKVGRVLRIPLKEELKFLPMKFQREYPLLRICQTFVMRHNMPIKICGVAYQFDGNVLFVYYEATERVDYRALVKFLIKMYCSGSRIHMKNIALCESKFVPLPFASEALVSGKRSDNVNVLPSSSFSATR